MSDETERMSVTLRRVFDAPIERVFRAWTEPQHVSRWMKCDAAATLQLDNWVPVVGNEFQTVMALEGVFEANGSGVFTAVDAPNLLAYTAHADEVLGVPEMHVRVELVDLDGKTELTLTHSGVPTNELCGIIEAGWTNSLGLLSEVTSTDLEGVKA